MTYDYELKENPCVKTGCTAFIAGLISHGDLFDLGDYYLLNCPEAPVRRDGDDLRINLWAEYSYATLQVGKVVWIDKRAVVEYDYAGRVVQV